MTDDQTFDSMTQALWGDVARASRVKTRWVSLVRCLLPPVGLVALDAASRHWLQGQPESLEPFRVAVWSYLDTKHGNSTSISDDEDRAMRVLIGCLFNEPDPNNLDLDWAVDMLSAAGVSEAQLRAVVAATP